MKKNLPLVELACVSKEYEMGKIKIKALKEVSLKIFPGELITVVGSSGSGKSTLLHIIGLLDKPSKGEVLVSGKNTRDLSDSQLAALRNRTVGFVFQQFNLLSRTSVLDNVLLPFLYNPTLEKRSALRKAEKIINIVGLIDRIEHFPNQLSGGEQQRVAIARALMCEPKLILADEPTGNLDSKTGKEIIDLLISLNRRQKRTLIFVTHDLGLAKLGERRIFLEDGRIVKEEK